MHFFSHRTSRRDSSSSESSIHGSLASLHSDGSLRESTPSYHESLLTPPRSPTDRQKLRSVNNRPRSWYDAQQLQGLGHISSESPTGFPFAASSYENLDKEGSTEKVLPRSSTIASLGAPKKDTLSHLVHARSFAGHEGRDSISPKPTSGSSPFLVAKHYPGGKSVSWQPPSSRTVDSEAGRAKFTSDSNVRRFFPEGAVLQTHRSRESPIMKIASAESDGSSVTSVPAVTSTRTFSTETQDLSMPTHRPVWDKATRDGSFDSSISEPVTLLQVNQREGEYVQHAPCKARPFGNRSQTIELSQIQQSRQGSSKKSRDKLLNKASISPSSVKEQVRKFDTRPDVVCPPCGVPVMPSGGRVSAEVAHYPVPSYKSATMPAKLFDVGDMDRRPSLPEQGERNVRYREQRLKELSALPSTVTSLPKRSQSIDVMGKNLSLFRSEAPSIGQDDMLIPTKTGSPRLMVSSQSSVTSSVSAMISKPDSIPLDVAKSVLSIHKPSSLPAVTEASVSSSFVQTENGVSSSDMMTKTKSSDAASVQPMSPPPMLITSRSSSPETKSIDVAQLSDEVTSSSKAVTADSDQSAFRPFVKGDDHQILASSEDVGHLSVSGSSGVSAKTGSFAAVQSATIDKQSAVSARKSPLLSVKSPTHSSVVSTSHSSRGSSSTSPRHSPRPLELWATKQSSPIREYHDPSDDDDDDGNDGEESGKSEKIKRGISQESIQSAMAVLDDAIAMLNSVAMDRSTGTVTAARTAAAAIVTAAAGMTAAGRSDTGIDLSRSGLLKYSSQATGSKTLVTGHFASMPLPSGHSGVEASLMPVSTISPSAVSPLAHGDLYQAVTQLASSVHTVMSSSQAVSSLSPGTAGMPNLIMSLPAGSAVTDTAAIEPSPRKETDNDRCGVSSNHSTAINIQTTDQPIVHADTSPLDQILASIQQEEDKLCASALKMKQPEGSTTLTRKKQETVTKFKDRPFDRDKPLEEIEARRKMLIQDDSFNRSDSEPDISSMPLPRDSVILRHRYHIKEDESSSSDSSSPATPRLSPRVMRRHKKPGSDSSTVADVKKKKLLNIPGKHK
ncbi:hypothetical protein LSH36_818g00048 [Paralvinella palmiformis]|uniref:Uncharacterized protein n=1 Tax=Paralvinella palmiformis TaxID=53620 RepID=A0AAD9IZ95_9ANNE|nr:hypothetical protein LSH36_818g00048 [Paralvinella palmiformis]